MKDKKNDKEKKERQTPIIDGDTRPDKNIEQPVQKPDNSLKDDRQFTTERERDVNSLEDFKDAK